MNRIAFTTLGCKANWVDTKNLVAASKQLGFSIVAFDDEADVYVVNTCTVTGVADQQSKQLLRRAKRKNPNALVIATGCLGQVDKETLAGTDGIDAVFGTDDREKIFAFICAHLKIENGDFSNSALMTEQSRARAFLKIQDGCNRSCAYCIIPKARGAARSVPIPQVVEMCRTLAQFHHEIILTGIDIGQYGADLKDGSNLVLLLKNLISIDAMPRIRLSSIDPSKMTDSLIDLIASSDKICRHVHLSIQSGADNVLKKMGRPYLSEDIKNVVQKLADAVKGVAITGDVIAGLPGETQTDHASTLKLLSSLSLAGLHVFPYSERKDTEAAVMPNKVPIQVRKTRAKDLRDLALKARSSFLSSLVGEILQVIVTSSAEEEAGTVEAFADNAVSVCMPAGVVSHGDIGRALITEVNSLKVKGLWDSHPKTKILSNDSKK